MVVKRFRRLRQEQPDECRQRQRARMPEQCKAALHRWQRQAMRKEDKDSAEIANVNVANVARLPVNETDAEERIQDRRRDREHGRGIAPKQDQSEQRKPSPMRIQRPLQHREAIGEERFGGPEYLVPPEKNDSDNMLRMVAPGSQVVLLQPSVCLDRVPSQPLRRQHLARVQVAQYISVFVRNLAQAFPQPRAS